MPAIGSAVGAVAGLFGATTGGLLARIGIAVGLSFLSRKLAPKPKDQAAAATSPSGSVTDVQLGTEVPRQIPIGVVKDPGHFVYFNTYGASNKFLQLVFVLGDWWCTSLASVWVDGKNRALISIATTGGETAAYNITGYGSLITVRFFDGRPTQIADAQLTNNSNPAGRWPSTNKMTGMCYVSLTIQSDATVFEGGSIPSFEWVLRGARLYDWRLDSTNGGSGSHRWATPSTWAYSTNPAVARYNFQRGFFAANGQRIVGMGLPTSDLLLDLYTSAANICDEIVTNPDATTEKRYSTSMVIRDDQKNIDVLRALDQCMAAAAVERQGAFAPIAGAGYTSIDTFTDADLVTGEDFLFSAKRSRTELINAVYGQFLNPAAQWQMDSYPSITDAALEAEDDEKLPSEGVDFPCVISHFQAQRLARIILNLSRCQASLSCVVGFHKIWYEVGDWIDFSSSTTVYSKTYQIVGRKIDRKNRKVYLVLQEITAAAYGDHVLEDLSPTVTDGDQLRPTTVASFNIQASTITNADGRVLPSLRFTWTPPDDPTIDRVVIEYRKVGTVPVFRVADDTPEDGLYETAASVVGGTDYEARATIVTTPSRTTSFTTWHAITTSAEVVTGTALDAQTRHVLALVTDDIPGSMTRRFNDADTLIQSLAATEATDRALLTAADQQIRTDLGATIAGVNAAVLTEQSARVAGDSANATAIQGVLATTTNNTAAIAAEQTARVSGDTSNANSIAAVSAAVNLKPNTYYQEAQPGAPHILGDFWVKPSNGQQYRWDGATFVQLTQATGVHIYFQDNAPGAGALNDLWIDSNDFNHMYRWDGTAWTDVRDGLIATNAAAIANESTARVTGDSALAQQVTQVDAKVGDVSANGFIRLKASASAPAGVTSQFEIQLNAGGPTGWVTSGFYMQIVGGVARIFLDADQIYMGKLNPNTMFAPFALIGGILNLQNVKAATLSAISGNMGTLNAGSIIGGLIRSANNNVRLELDNDRLLFLE